MYFDNLDLFSSFRNLRPLARDFVCQVLYLSGLTRSNQTKLNKLTIIMLHRVLPEHLLLDYPLKDIAISVEEFQWFLNFFTRYYTCGSLTEIYNRWQKEKFPEKPFLVITFDDGQIDNYCYALPLLDKANVKASFFVPVNAVDNNQSLWPDRVAYALQNLNDNNKIKIQNLLTDLSLPIELDKNILMDKVINKLKQKPAKDCISWIESLEKTLNFKTRPHWDGIMGWDELHSLISKGHEVGSHSLSHAILTNVDDEQLWHEVKKSRERLQKKLGIEIESFAYPNGNYDSRVTNALKRAGYRLAITTENGLNNVNSEPLCLSRCHISSQLTKATNGKLSEYRLAFRVSPYFSLLHL